MATPSAVPRSAVAPVPVRLAGRTTLFHLLLLAVATFAIYADSLRNGFVADDQLQILRNRWIRDFQSLLDVFTHSVWAFDANIVSNYYRPLHTVVYMVEFYLFGSRPAAWHAANLVFHLCALFAAYFLVRAVAGAQMAFWTALWFALHPVHVEAVVWVAVVPDLFCALALFVGTYLYHRARTGGNRVLFHGLATLAFFAGLLFKETAFVFPGILLAYEFFYRRTAPVEIVRGLPRYLPYAVIVGVYIWMRLHALGSLAPSWGQYYFLKPWEIFLSVTVLVAQYVVKLLVPVHLNYLYVFEPTRTLNAEAIASLSLLAVLVGAMFWLRRVRPLLAFALAWFLVTLAPVLNIPNFAENVFAERYLYIPSLGFCIFAAQVWLHLHERATVKALRWTLYGALATVFIFYAGVVLQRVPEWKDELRLYSKTVELSPRSAYARSGLGYTYYRLGKVDRAVEQFRLSLELNPNNVQTHLNMALALDSQGHPEEAIRHLARAVQLRPNFMPTWQALGLVYVNQGDWAHAVECYRRALALDPEPARTEVRLGVALAHEGSLEEAIDHLRKALAAEPQNEVAWRELGLVYARQRRWDQATECYRAALKSKPADSGALTALGVALHSQGDPAGAIAAYRRAIEVQPNYIEAHINLAVEFAQAGRTDESIAQLLTALRINPRAPQAPLAHYTLGLNYEEKHLWDEAAHEYEQTLALNSNFSPARQRLEAVRARRRKGPH